MHKGSCLCGAVTFEVTCPLPPPDACHCIQCRKWSGHFLVGPDIPRDAVTVHGAENVTWFRSSDRVRRGFCSICGSSLFFDPSDPATDRPTGPWLGIALGAFDRPTGTRIALHIFVAEKGDYYDITDDAPQYDRIPVS